MSVSSFCPSQKINKFFVEVDWFVGEINRGHYNFIKNLVEYALLYCFKKTRNYKLVILSVFKTSDYA